MATQSEKDVAIGLARKALKDGKVVCVYGIMNKHTRVLKQLPKSKIHIVTEEKADRAPVPKNTGVVLLCGTNSHGKIRHLENLGVNVFKRVFTWGALTSILSDGCADLLKEDAAGSKTAEVEPLSATPSAIQLLGEALAAFVKSTTTPIEHPENMRSFAKAFVEIADANGGVVPSREVVELSDTHKAGGVIHLTKCGWISGVVLEGKVRITAYQATQKLVDVARQHTDAKELDEIGRAMQIIAEEPALVRQLETLTERLGLIQKLKGYIDNINKAVDSAKR